MFFARHPMDCGGQLRLPFGRKACQKRNRFHCTRWALTMRLRQLLTSILIGLALLLSAERNATGTSQHLARNQHQTETKPHTETVQQPKPEIPLPIWPQTIAAFDKAIAAYKEQAIAAQKQTEAQKETFCSPGVVVNEVLAVIGFGYLFLMHLQWRSTEKSLRITQRAEVTLGRPDGRVMELLTPQVGKPLGVKAYFFNSGRTAAQEFLMRAMISHGTRGASVQWDMDRPELIREEVTHQGYRGIRRSQTCTIGAGAIQVCLIGSDYALTDEDVRAIEANATVIMITGKFQYTDGFGKQEFRTYHVYNGPQVGEFIEFIPSDMPFRSSTDMPNSKK
jgi:hypothetical protein